MLVSPHVHLVLFRLCCLLLYLFVSSHLRPLAIPCLLWGAFVPEYVIKFEGRKEMILDSRFLCFRLR